MFKRLFTSLFLSESAVLSIAALSPGQLIKQVTRNPAQDYHIKWSPDGKRIAFSSNQAGNTDVWVKDVK
jgi:Tol biopolymer transport system component